MAQYRKKPVVVDATQWFENGDHPEDRWTPEGVGPEGLEGNVVRYYRHPKIDGKTVCSKCNRLMHDHGWVDTLEDGHNVCPGDWIITGVQGEYYPCKPDVFAETYEIATESEPKSDHLNCRERYECDAYRPAPVCQNIHKQGCFLQRS